VTRAVDWSRGDLTHGVYALMVDPGNLADVRGQLRGVTGGRLDLAYYGDTRMGAELVTHGAHEWDGSAAIRVVHTVSDYAGQLLQETLFTGYVTAAAWEGEGADLVTTWTLSGTLHGAEADVAETGYSVAKGSSALEVIGKICRTIGRPFVIGPTAVEYVLGSNKVYEAGTAWLSVLNDLANASGNRIGVDELGRLTVERYVAPSSRGVDWVADEREPRGMVIGEVTGDIGELDAPDRVVVRAENGDSVVTGMAYAPSGSSVSKGVRGYRVTRFEVASDLSPFTVDSARTLAKRYLDESGGELPAIHHGLMYRPMREGMIERLTRRDGTSARWMVSGASLDLSAWTWDLDLKGGWK
jgi:hypothetical protein